MSSEKTTTLKKGPPRWWFKANDEFYSEKHSIKVRQELDLNSHLIPLLLNREEEFIKWAGRNRMNYDPSLIDEIEEFLNPVPKEGIRLYNTNGKLWKRICSEVFKRDNYTCAYCNGYGLKLECDHIVPFSKGGTNDLSNLTTSCQKCNRQKKDKSVSEFLAWRESKCLA